MNKREPLIVKWTIGSYPRPMPKGMHDPMPKVNVQFDNGEEQHIFEFYPDEISFMESEFIGLTEEEAHRLRVRKDIEYLQS